MIILGIETTCDETGVGIVRDGREMLANLVSSSVRLHEKYQGIVPEVAAREQMRSIIPVIETAIHDTRYTIHDIDAIAVAYGPGLVGSLLVGVETAKTLAIAWNKPLIPVNHLIGHVYANWLKQTSDYRLRTTVEPDSAEAVDSRLLTGDFPRFPLVALIVSGGHTDLILMTDHGKFKWLGGTRDDAAGEVFDKVARILGLGYPGGPEVERVARQLTVDGSQSTVKFPRPMINEDNFDFSFSGLKTAVVNLIQKSKSKNQNLVGEVAYEFQNAIVDVLVTKTIRAAKKFGAKSIVVGGGVAANNFLRSRFTSLRPNFAQAPPGEQGFAGRVVHRSQLKIPVFFPSRELSVDNGAMIAVAAFYNQKIVSPQRLQANPSLYF